MFLLAVSLILSWPGPPSEWELLPAFQHTEGFAGAFAGESHGHLLVAGGANFPNAKPWEGGTKHWYDDVHVLDREENRWRIVGKLPHDLGYGISVSHGNKLICLGGSNETRHYADVFSIEYKDDSLHYTQLPALPSPLANASGVLIGNKLFVVGGQAEPTSKQALCKVWSLDLSNRSSAWQQEPPLPGAGRILCMVGGHIAPGNLSEANSVELYVFGGVELYESGEGVQRRYLRDAYVLRNNSSWHQLPDLPHELAACATPLPLWNNRFYLVSGDDGTQVGKFWPDHRGFPSTIWAFDIKTQRWKQAGNTPAPRVTLPTYQKGSEVFFFSGEKTPGIRSPENWRWDLRAMSP
jgi:N-acetylneuraminic acid mutarotase